MHQVVLYTSSCGQYRVRVFHMRVTLEAMVAVLAVEIAISNKTNVTSRPFLFSPALILFSSLFMAFVVRARS